MPPAVPMWLRMVKDVRMPRFRRAMQRPLVTATRRLFSGIACQDCSKASRATAGCSTSASLGMNAVCMYVYMARKQH
jgi:CxxC motif-containing protein (DUF1111 family)